MRKNLPTFGRVLASELERDLQIARTELLASLNAHPERSGPRADVFLLVHGELQARALGIGPLPPIDLTLAARRR